MLRFPAILAAMMCIVAQSCCNVIDIEEIDGDATEVLRGALAEASRYGGRAVTIRFSPGDYHLSRIMASQHVYYVSNTASAEENPDPTKHIGIWLKGLQNVTIDGRGARLVTHGEMTPIVIDSCSNVTLKNFSLTAADPTVPEFRVLGVDSAAMTVEVTAPSRFEIDKGRFYFEGEGWRFPDANLPELAQVFYPEDNVTQRCDSPLRNYCEARRLNERVVEFVFDSVPDVRAGEIYHMRHGIRSEVCAFINRSRDICIENAEFNFLGNFGLVGQFSENITYDNIRCCPEEGSGRTDAGFADFVLMSSCRGRISIVNSYFEGAHDDPINIHGTHLVVMPGSSGDRLIVRYMHGQTYGFAPCVADDEVEVVDRRTLNARMTAKVRDVNRLSDYDYELRLNRRLPDGIAVDDLAVENISWTPEVEIANNYFARIPTRGILITTRGKSVIEDNVFYRMPMSAVLISDDARGWYESGPVHGLTIRRNTFVECGSPVIAIWPEIERFEAPVHKNIKVADNHFILRPGSVAVSVRGSENIVVCDNEFDLADSERLPVDSLVEARDVSGLVLSGNRVMAR